MKAAFAFLSAVLLGSLVFASQIKPSMTPAPGGVWPPPSGANPNSPGNGGVWPPTGVNSPGNGGVWPPQGSNSNTPQPSWPPMTPSPAPQQQPSWPPGLPGTPSNPAPTSCVTTFDCVISATACKTANSMSIGEQDFGAAGTITYMTTTNCPSGQRRSTYVSVVGGQDARSCVDLVNQYLSQTPQCQ